MGQGVRRVTFTPAGSVSGIPLVQHQCLRTGSPRTWVSAVPSADDDPFTVPFCGCRP